MDTEASEGFSLVRLTCIVLDYMDGPSEDMQRISSLITNERFKKLDNLGSPKSMISAQSYHIFHTDEAPWPTRNQMQWIGFKL